MTRAQIKKIDKVWLISLVVIFLTVTAAQAQFSPTQLQKVSTKNPDNTISQSANYKVVTKEEQPVPAHVLASTNYTIASGFWRDQAPQNTCNAANSAEMVPKEFKLCQNYPNPFNPTTTIEYHLPQAARVTLTIYDIQGHQVRQWTQGTTSPGYYAIHWDGRNEAGLPVASGTYFYRLVAGNHNDIKRCLLLK